MSNSYVKQKRKKLKIGYKHLDSYQYNRKLQYRKSMNEVISKFSKSALFGGLAGSAGSLFVIMIITLFGLIFKIQTNEITNISVKIIDYAESISIVLLIGIIIYCLLNYDGLPIRLTRVQPKRNFQIKMIEFTIFVAMFLIILIGIYGLAPVN